MAVLHDFCAGFPYAFALMLGGLTGFLIRGSTVSLCMGAATGAVMLLCAYSSLRAYKAGARAWLATAVGAADSAVVSVVMARRYPPMQVTARPQLVPGVLFVAVRCAPPPARRGARPSEEEGARRGPRFRGRDRRGGERGARATESGEDVVRCRVSH